MKRTRLHALNPDSARKRIKAAKANKPFMTALLDRAHLGHRDAMAHWTRLHEVVFQERTERSSGSHRGEASPNREFSPRSASAEDDFARRPGARLGKEPSRTAAIESSSARRSAITVHTSASRKNQSSRQQYGAEGTAKGQGTRQSIFPDPERPLDVDQQRIAPLLRRPGESESDWLRRLMIAASGAQKSGERLALIREAILQEIGFYDVGSGSATRDDMLRDSDWRVLAALQNVPVDGWEGAERIDEARADFERRGTLSFNEVIGPDGNVYHRMSILGGNPVGDVLQTIDGRIRLLQPPEPDSDVSSILPLVRQTRPSRRGGTPPRSPLVTNVAPRAYQFIRSRQGTAAIGLGIGLTGGTTLQRAGGFDMERAPDMPPVPGFDPPEPPETGRESTPADLPPIPPLPGFMPEDYANLIEIFPDQRGDLPMVDILDRWGSPETQLFNTETMRGVRDLARAIGVKVWHRGGGRPDNESDYAKELWLTAADGGGVVGSSYLDIAFESKRTERKLLINTVDTRADNVTLTGREERAAVRILRNSDTGDILVTLAKPPRGQAYDLERFLEWIRPLVEEIDRDLPEGSGGHQRRFDFR